MSTEHKDNNILPSNKKGVASRIGKIVGYPLSAILGGEGYGLDYARGIRVLGEGILNDVSKHVPHIVLDCFPSNANGKDVVEYFVLPVGGIVIYQLTKNTIGSRIKRNNS
jgi:hypothetical protein